VLSSIAVTVTLRVESQSKEHALGHTFALLDAALGQFCDYQYRYPYQYADFRFPLDCNDFPVVALQKTLLATTGAADVLVLNHVHPNGTEYVEYSGCEVMYFLLSQIPEVRGTLAKINPSFVTNKNGEGNLVTISINNGPAESLLRVVDPWGTTLRYGYYRTRSPDWSPLPETKKTFPVLISAGPDRVFGTGDDLNNRGKR
jgi:hypothetical protein